jgi:two-component system OmpR family sensor kinase
LGKRKLSVLKSWDTNLQQREKKTLWAFLGLYLFLSCAILGLFGFGYYEVQKEAMLRTKRVELNQFANDQVRALRELHVAFDKTQRYPRSEKFRSAVYDADEVEIFSLLHVAPLLSRIIYLKEGMIHYIKEPEAHYLGTRFLVLEVPDSGEWRKEAFQTMGVFGAIILLLLGVGGYFLLQLFLRPMKEAVALLDRFIKDTTHELNTPLNAILTNIEMIQTQALEPSLAKKFRRIRIGAQTVTNLYQDLTFLTLGHRMMSQDERVDMVALLEERVEYFSVSCDTKKITVSLDASPAALVIDRKKITKIVDNLLSNAIKYNHQGGAIDVRIVQGVLEVKDTGRGINASVLKNVFDRYARFDTSVGGFGIGLSIVMLIAKEYDVRVEIDSQEGEGTCVRLLW